MLPLLAGAAGMAGAKLLGGALGNNDDEEAKQRALTQLHQGYANGQLAQPMAPPVDNPNPLMGAIKGVGLGAVTDALSPPKKPGEENPDWWKSAARGALGSGVLGGR